MFGKIKENIERGYYDFTYDPAKGRFHSNSTSLLQDDLKKEAVGLLTEAQFKKAVRFAWFEAREYKGTVRILEEIIDILSMPNEDLSSKEFVEPKKPVYDFKVGKNHSTLT